MSCLLNYKSRGHTQERTTSKQLLKVYHQMLLQNLLTILAMLCRIYDSTLAILFRPKMILTLVNHETRTSNKLFQAPLC